MAMVVTAPCTGCRHADCVKVCPVEAFYAGPDSMVIHPDECTECEACISECPEEAIFHEDDVPEQWSSYIGLNRQYAEQWPVAADVL